MEKILESIDEKFEELESEFDAHLVGLGADMDKVTEACKKEEEKVEESNMSDIATEIDELADDGKKEKEIVKIIAKKYKVSSDKAEEWVKATLKEEKTCDCPEGECTCEKVTEDDSEKDDDESAEHEAGESDEEEKKEHMKESDDEECDDDDDDDEKKEDDDDEKEKVEESDEEEVIDEKDIKDEEGLKAYANQLAKEAFDSVDQKKVDSIVKNAISKSDGDWGKAVGIVQSSFN